MPTVAGWTTFERPYSGAWVAGMRPAAGAQICPAFDDCPAFFLSLKANEPQAAYVPAAFWGDWPIRSLQSASWNAGATGRTPLKWWLDGRVGPGGSKPARGRGALWPPDVGT